MLLNCAFHRMLTLTYSIPFTAKPLKLFKLYSRGNVVVCAAKGPRPRYPRVWKTQKKIGTISKSAKLVECVKGLSNVKEEVYGALDSFIAWDLEFPLITVKKALTTFEREKDWKRIIQVTKWMLSKGQGKTMGSYLVLLNALIEDDRLDEAEELWTKIFTEKLESTPRTFFEKMVSVYYKKGMHDKLFEVFADMDELGIHPTASVVTMVGNVFQELGMIDKYQKLLKKYPPPKWEYMYVKGKRIKVPAKHLCQPDGANQSVFTKRVNEAEVESNLHIEQSMESSEAAMINEDSHEVFEESSEENNTNPTEQWEEAETSSMELDG